MAEDTPGFLGRWVRRKNEVLNGGTPQAPVLSLPATPAEPAATAMSATPDADEIMIYSQEKALSLDDVRWLTKDSDFKPFMAQGVNASVRNAAVKKLFTDPHFNVMDGLDTYIDDYSKSDPIPEAMLRQMTSAKFLGLFADEEGTEKPALVSPLEDANNPSTETVPQSCENVNTASTAPAQPTSQSASLPDAMDAAASQETHADTDLRLQPDHATSAPSAGSGA